MLNYRQLHYFWVVAKTGSIVRACEQLNLTPQTISGQISLLEDTHGLPLFRRVGRQLELTEHRTLWCCLMPSRSFRSAVNWKALLRMAPKEQQILFRVGVADVVPQVDCVPPDCSDHGADKPICITCREDKLDRPLRISLFSVLIW